VTLDVLADTFNLSKPYLSKYIKEKSGMTFQDAVKKARMKKARRLLKETNQTVESIAASVGYENVEHFNRLFKKAYDMTPVQFRRQYK
ncbi:MAG: helix-turn-helix transcriptional regulator, partial [Eubacterium sp.]|nr:helix-turn-helix transcriptional regulator [Eubacterium sp.]